MNGDLVFAMNFNWMEVLLYFSTAETTDMLQKLTLEPKTKAYDAPEVTKKVYITFIIVVFIWTVLLFDSYVKFFLK